jgi:hypothetical protein
MIHSGFQPDTPFIVVSICAIIQTICAVYFARKYTTVKKLYDKIIQANNAILNNKKDE